MIEIVAVTGKGEAESLGEWEHEELPDRGDTVEVGGQVYLVLGRHMRHDWHGSFTGVVVKRAPVDIGDERAVWAFHRSGRSHYLSTKFSPTEADG